jgi:hypothetical protein
MTEQLQNFLVCGVASEDMVTIHHFRTVASFSLAGSQKKILLSNSGSSHVLILTRQEQRPTSHVQQFCSFVLWAGGTQTPDPALASGSVDLSRSVCQHVTGSWVTPGY